jgi:hypothetical protein
MRRAAPGTPSQRCRSARRQAGRRVRQHARTAPQGITWPRHACHGRPRRAAGRPHRLLQALLRMGDAQTCALRADPSACSVSTGPYHIRDHFPLASSVHTKRWLHNRELSHRGLQEHGGHTSSRLTICAFRRSSATRCSAVSTPGRARLRARGLPTGSAPGPRSGAVNPLLVWRWLSSSNVYGSAKRQQRLPTAMPKSGAKRGAGNAAEVLKVQHAKFAKSTDHMPICPVQESSSMTWQAINALQPKIKVWGTPHTA